MKYFKMVSGKGRIEMTESEINEMKNIEVPLIEEPSKFEVLEERVNRISNIFERLEKSELFKALLTASERQVKENGDS